MTYQVPGLLRAPIAGYNDDDSVSDLVFRLLESDSEFKGLDLSEKYDLLSGLKVHQEAVAKGEKKVFPVTVKRVETIERRGGEDNFLLGTKARIVYDARNEDGEIEEQHIDTNWTSKFVAPKWNDEDDIYQSGFFSVSLAQTIRDIALENIGQKVLLRKVNPEGTVTGANGKKVKIKYCADIIPPQGAKASPASRIMKILRNDPVVQGLPDVDLSNDSDEDFKALGRIANDARTNSITLREALVDMLKRNQIEVPDSVVTGADELDTAVLYRDALLLTDDED